MNIKNTFIKQQGAVLIVSLIILLVMTLIGVTAMQTTTMEERMAGNMRDQNFAFQAAEIALRDAEDFIEQIATTGGFNGTDGLHGLADTEPDYTDSATWSSATSSRAYSTDTPAPDIDGIQTQPRYFIKIISSVAPASGGSKNIGGMNKESNGVNTTTFRITARGTGQSNDSRVMLREYYARKVN